MTLGDIIKKYREDHGISMDAFSKKSGISKAYISILEKNKRPGTEKPVAPSINCIKQAADGMDMDFNVLFSMIDSDVTLNDTDDDWKPTLSKKEENDINKKAENFIESIDSDTGLMFNGEPIDDETRRLFKNALEVAMQTASLAAKKKFTPKKYRK